ncbi:uncharacterized protein LOC143038670 [Oratosquilla oratoria]|uniref:uncharacterized protein LOC143038670 n=1 Tax=Oratosquilla oratoria TaxID=337810 RepID=UPI003F758356
MPPCKKVSSLKELTHDKVLYNICAVILDEIFFSEDEEWDVYGPPVLTKRLELVRDFLAGSLTPSLEESLLNTVLQRDDSVEATIRYIAVQILLVPGVQHLATGSFPETFYSYILDIISANGSGLEELDLRGVWIRENDTFYLYKALRRLPNLRRLTVRYNCDDTVLGVIGKYCKQLQKLDISGSPNISDVGVKSLCYNQTQVAQGELNSLVHSLQLVDIGGPGGQKVSVKEVSFLIKNLPNLLSVGSYERTGAALEVLEKDHPSAQYGLLYLHDVFTTSGRLLSIIRTCPKLQAIYLDRPKSIAVQNLDVLKSLKEVKLNQVRWADVEVLLKKWGQQLRSLFLLTVWGQFDLVDIGALCPNLIRIELHKVSLSGSTVSHDTAFKKVAEFLLYNSTVDTQCIKLIMNHCTSVEHLSLGECGQLTDAAMICSMMDHSLKSLRELWLGLAENLTMRTVEALIEHCPNLTSLGNLAAWSIHPEDLDLLRVQLHLTNTNLTLHEYGPEGEEFIVI